MRIDTNPVDPAQSGAGERPATLHRSWLREMEKAQLALLVELPGQPAADRDGAERPRDDAPSRQADEQTVRSQNLRPVWWQQAPVDAGSTEQGAVAKTDVAVAEAAPAPETTVAAEPMQQVAKAAAPDASAAPVARPDAGFVAAEASATATAVPQAPASVRGPAPNAATRATGEEAATAQAEA